MSISDSLSVIQGSISAMQRSISDIQLTISDIQLSISDIQGWSFPGFVDGIGGMEGRIGGSDRRGESAEWRGR
jgi:hypothetical protein